jgi:D-alanine--poly(phosphoribitol) ligase subunit 1
MLTTRDKLIESFEKNGSNNALCINNTFYTYHELWEKVLIIQNHISKHLTNVDILGLVTNNDFETYASILAIWFAGKGYVPLNPKFPLNRNQEIIDKAELKYIISSQKYSKSDNLNNLTGVSYLHTSDFEIASNNRSDFTIDNDGIAYILFTSGSTGSPKGVPITFNNWESFLASYDDLGLHLHHTDRCLQMFDLTFDVSVASYIIPLLSGACVYTVDNEGIKYLKIVKILKKHRITFAVIVPSILSFLKEYLDDLRLDDITTTIFTAEASYHDLIEKWSACVPNSKIVNLYGPTEATIWCLSYFWDKEVDPYNGMIPIGNSFTAIETILVNKEDAIVEEQNEMGELCIFGGQITSGYWKDDAKNEQAFVNIEVNGKTKRFYRTGDLSYRTKSGIYMYCGRKDYQVQIQGFRVELNEIEFKVKNKFEISNVVVLPHTNENGTTEITLFVETNEYTNSVILTFLKEVLPFYMIPNAIVILDKFPLNQSDKIDRVKLKSMIKN